MATVEAKESGAYYTPADVAATLVRWAVHKPDDKLLDSSCGDGQFLCHYVNATGIEQDHQAAIAASRRAPGRVIHVEDFFLYAQRTTKRFDCAAGNPPFIRYQRFAGEIRQRALKYCERVGARFSALTSSWAPFIVATASLLKSGGRLAFVVPAEIGHAPYAVPLLRFLCRSFAKVQLIMIRKSVFDRLSQDVWLLYADGYGGNSSEVQISIWDRFRSILQPPRSTQRVSLRDWDDWGCKFRPFLLSDDVRQLYRSLNCNRHVCTLGEAARVGIGYVTGDNKFFHLRPSEAESAGIPKRFLLPTVRKGRALPTETLDDKTLSLWVKEDEPCLLLRLKPQDPLPNAIIRYLDSAAARKAQRSYKCRHRTPWYVVPDVVIPDGFLSYMSGECPIFVGNEAKCTCTNSVLAVRMKDGHTVSEIHTTWRDPVTQLSAELEGHPLGGGMLKIEPREANRIMLRRSTLRLTKIDLQQIEDARDVLRAWRHYE